MQESQGTGIIIKGGKVLTLDDKPGYLENADVLIQDGLIKSIGTLLESGAGRFIDTAGCLCCLLLDT